MASDFTRKEGIEEPKTIAELEEQTRMLEERFRDLGVMDDPSLKRFLEDRRALLEQRRRDYETKKNSLSALEAPEDDLLKEEDLAAGRAPTARQERIGRSASPWTPNAELPRVRSEFDRVRVGVVKEKVPAKATHALKLQPPTPKGMGQGGSAQVSPQLREQAREDIRAKLRNSMLLKREFRRVSRDGFER